MYLQKNIEGVLFIKFPLELDYVVIWIFENVGIMHLNMEFRIRSLGLFEKKKHNQHARWDAKSKIILIVIATC